jgi:2-C-methyl-D-erythritol 4-phosphate cytidylyltransferase
MARHRVHAIVPAAGAGRRMAQTGAPPKQYRRLHGRPMLQWSVERACAHPDVAAVTVAIAADDDGFEAIRFELPCPVDHVEGGETRAQSVLNAVRHVRATTGAEWVLVHDAARPCLGPIELGALITAAHSTDQGAEHGALLALPVGDTLKRGDGEPPQVIETVDREGLWAAQTPQLFPTEALSRALEARLAADAPPTDEAGAMEAAGYRPRLVMGSGTNLKVTWPGDMELAAAILQWQEKA